MAGKFARPLVKSRASRPVTPVHGRLGDFDFSPDPFGPASGAPDASDAVAWRALLSGCLDDPLSVRAMREALEGHFGAESVARMADTEVLAQVGQLAALGRLRLVPLADRLPSGGSGAGSGAGSSPAAAQPAPARPAPAPAPRQRPAAPAEEPTFAPDLDAGAMVAALLAAAEEGVPFCEECARRRAAAGAA